MVQKTLQLDETKEFMVTVLYNILVHKMFIYLKYVVDQYCSTSVDSHIYTDLIK